ncbi:MAG: ferredoxin/flavodoxin---NADP+ reductase [Nocardioidaceae bacterium]|nr:ferredoxin/flavodoxin---NADP+ reductase [Nocardioidaceae bacterium]
MLRVAIIGSGPAGIYAVEALTRDGLASVDVLDRLPCPFGLVRYGVAPDHPKIRSISAALSSVLEQPGARFFGNVEIGSDVSLAELQDYYDAVVIASGAAVDRRLGIPGEDLPGSRSATDFVAWYNGHPDAPLDAFALGARSVAVIGMGNVAVDVVRLLAKTADDLRATDMPDHVLDELDRSAATDIHMIGRRGPAQAKFTTRELRELGEIANADVVVRESELELDPVSELLLAGSPAVRRNLDVLREWASRPPGGRPRRVHLRFWLRPAAILAAPDGTVSALQVEQTAPDDGGSAVGTGRLSTIDAQLVLRSVGYRGLPIPGLPFDERTGTVPNDAGRVVRDGAPVSGLYVAGWSKRGPTGVIGTNKHDARETVASLLEDAPLLPRAPRRDPDDIVRLFAERDVRPVDWEGWRAIERAEAILGRQRGNDRVRITERAALLRAAHGE